MSRLLLEMWYQGHFNHWSIAHNYLELKEALVIMELGSSREMHHLKPKIDTLQDIASEPNAIHGWVKKGWNFCKLILDYM